MRRLAKWVWGVLEDLSPVIPDLSDDYVGAENGEKPFSGGGLSAPADATPTQIGSVGEKPTSSAYCKICNGSGTIGMGGGPSGSMSYYVAPCPECNNPLMKELDKLLLDEAFEETDKLNKACKENTCKKCGSAGEYGESLQRPGNYGEPQQNDFCAKCQVEWEEYAREELFDPYDNDPFDLGGWSADEVNHPPEDYEEGDVVWEGDLRDKLRGPNYDAVESWETPKAEDFMAKCEYCDGAGKTGEGFVCADCKGEGEVLSDKRYGSHICNGKERSYSSMFCAFCRGNQKASDLKIELSKANKRIEKLEKELQYASNARDTNYLTANDETAQKLKAIAEVKALRECLDTIQDHLSRVYQGYYDKS